MTIFHIRARKENGKSGRKKRESVYLDIADGPTRKRPNEHEHLQRICGKIHLNREKLEESLNS